jgi:hypothetical protein
MIRFLTPAEAEERFGELTFTAADRSHGGIKTWRIIAGDGGVWKPVFQGTAFLIGYEWEWN